MRILVTNDDGIDSIGLHILARRMREHGDVVVVAPDSEYSGAGAAVGALHAFDPEAHEASIDGIDAVWTINGPPALCVLVAGLGPFGPFDLVVAGINPGANVGRSVYHSGTVGAALSARLRGVTGIAVSQKVDSWGIEGQAWDDMIADQKWETAADVASVVVGATIARPPLRAQVINVNVPNLPTDEVKGWRHTTVAGRPARSFATATLEPKPGHEGAHKLRLDWGEPDDADPDTDTAVVANGEVSISWLTELRADDVDPGAVGFALDTLV